MEYKEYWSIADLGTNSLRSYEVCFYITVFFILVFLLTKKFKKSNQDYEKTIMLWFSGFLSLIAFLGFFYLKFFTVDSTNKRIENLLNSKNIGKVEGVISEFESVKPLSQRGKVTHESFVVDSVEFSYSDALLGRFNRFSQTNNGVFRDGLPVRITYMKNNNEILKVEISESDIILMK